MTTFCQTRLSILLTKRLRLFMQKSLITHSHKNETNWKKNSRHAVIQKNKLSCKNNLIQQWISKDKKQYCKKKWKILKKNYPKKMIVQKNVSPNCISQKWSHENYIQ